MADSVVRARIDPPSCGCLRGVTLELAPLGLAVTSQRGREQAREPTSMLAREFALNALRAGP